MTWTLGGADARRLLDQLSATCLTCDFGTTWRRVRGSRTITVSKTSDADDCDAIPNNVTVAASNEANDDDTDEQQRQRRRSSSTAPTSRSSRRQRTRISAGEVAEFTIVVTNLGAGTAYDVSLTDTLPGGVAWTARRVGAEVADPDAHCTISGIS